MTRPTSGARELAGRVGSFAGLSLIASTASFLVLPVVARVATTQEWASIALGQSLGALLAIVVTLGWSLTGPSLVASTLPRERAALYAESLLSRGAIFVLLLPVATAAAFLLAPQSERALAMVVCAAALAAGVGIEWYCVGTGSWQDIAKYDVVPRIVASLAAVPLVAISGEVLYYAVVVLVSVVVGIGLFSVKELRGVDMRTGRHLSDLRATFRRSGSAFATELAGGTYSAGSPALVSAASDAGNVALFASGDRIYRLALMALVALARALQGWVIVEGGLVRQRVRTAVVTHAALGLVGGVLLGAFGPWASGVLFGDRLAFGVYTGWAFGLAFLAISVNTALGRMLLVPSGRVRPVMASTVAGSLLGIPSILVGAAQWGAPGGAMGLALSQVGVVLWQVPPSLDAWRALSPGSQRGQ